MSSTASSESSWRKPRNVKSLKSTRVDFVASWLMSTLIVIAMLVLLLFVVWLTQTFSWQAQNIRIDQERAAGRGDHAEGFERDIEPPGSQEIEELTEPTLAEMLQAVTDSVTTVAAAVESFDTDATMSTYGSAMGDSRPPGPPGEGEDIVPRFERWELKFQAKGLRAYASQLDFYRIELACVGGQIPTVDYAFSLSGSPQKRSGAGGDEKRLYFMWREDGPLKQFDQQLLSNAGVATQARLLVKFIPKELEEQLEKIEMAYAITKGHSSIREVAKTIFESQANASGGYSFAVIEQRYRQLPRQ